MSGFKEFEQGNYLLREMGCQNLRTMNGFFICSDSYGNRSSRLPKIILTTSTVEIFSISCPGVFSDARPLTNWFRDYDRLDFQKFINDAKLAYLFAVAYYLTNVPSGVYVSFRAFFSPAQSRSIRGRIGEFVPRFFKMASDARVFPTRRAMFEFAKGIIMSRVSDNKGEVYLKNIERYLSSKECNFYSNMLGSGFESYCRAGISNEAGREASELQKKAAKLTGEEGVFINLDTSHAFRQYAGKIQGIRIPDLLYVTRSRIYPADLKASLSFAKPKQVSRDNLAALLVAARPAMSSLFSLISVDGRPY